MLEVMREKASSSVWGDAHTLDEAFARSGCRVKVSHPLNKWQAVLDALDRDSRFDKMFARVDLWHRTGWHKSLVRCFTIRS